MTRTDILEILKSYKNENSEKYGISSLGIFGSFSRDNARDESDVDIIIETIEPDLFKLVHKIGRAHV